MKTCLCCGYKTLDDNSIYDICPICFWEDDPMGWENPDSIGGANGDVSLRKAQKNFMKYGACDRESMDCVRKPNVNDIHDINWKPV